MRERLLERRPELSALDSGGDLSLEPCLSRGKTESSTRTGGVRGIGRRDSLLGFGNGVGGGGGDGRDSGRRRWRRHRLLPLIRLRRHLQRAELLSRARCLFRLASKHGSLSIHRLLRFLRGDGVSATFLARCLQRSLCLPLFGDALLCGAFHASHELDARSAEPMNVCLQGPRREIALLAQARRFFVFRGQLLHLLQALLELLQSPAVLRLHLTTNILSLLRRRRKRGEQLIALFHEFRFLRLERREQPPVLLSELLDVLLLGASGRRRAPSANDSSVHLRLKLRRLRGHRAHARLLCLQRSLHGRQFRLDLVPFHVLLELQRGLLLILHPLRLIFLEELPVEVVRRRGVLSPGILTPLVERRQLLFQPRLFVSQHLNGAQIASDDVGSALVVLSGETRVLKFERQPVALHASRELGGC